jgi:hypothetical protein
MSSDSNIFSSSSIGDTYRYLSAFPTITYDPPKLTTGVAIMDKAVQDKANELVKAEKAEALLPYPKGLRKRGAMCPKCGMVTYGPIYHTESDSAPEYLSWKCACGYEMKTIAKDAVNV